ncbi:hypothetical protein ACS0TY_014200 [Phlomoides rotata]
MLPPLRRRHPPLLFAPATISAVRHPLTPLAATPPRRSQLVNGKHKGERIDMGYCRGHG